MTMATFSYVVSVVIFIFRLSADACPVHCKAGQICDAADSGCPECEEGYYGRSCQHGLECLFTTQGLKYRGTRNTTVNGKTCQRWDTETPHSDIIRSPELIENYCRNPDREPEPWCYTTDPDKRWEFCKIPSCSNQCLAPLLTSSGVDILNPPRDGFAVGFYALISCRADYEASGQPTFAILKCADDKTWTKSPLPACKKVQCSSFMHANISITNPKSTYEYGDNITVACKIGYTLQGQNNLTCQADKSWGPSLPVCIVNECPAPSSVTNGFISGTKAKYVFQDTVTIKCIAGYVLNGTDKMTCQANKAWSTSSTCKKVQCSSFMHANISITNPKSTYEYGDNITVACKIGYTLQGQNNLTCQADKSWGPSLPVCIVNECPAPSSVTNGFISGTKAKYVFQDTVTIKCIAGYVLNGTDKMTCQANKAWSTSSTCKRACPSNCKAGQACDSADSGCPECQRAYYGRQCQHRLECKFTPKGTEYQGKQNTTVSERTCQRWDTNTPHKHDMKYSELEENYCRNPDGGPEPWCYTTDPCKPWEICGVPLCSDQCLPPPLNSPSVDIINPPSIGFVVGFNATIGCMPGYEASGQVETVSVTCGDDKHWTQSSLPICNS